MAVVRVVQAAADEVIDVVAVRHGFVAAAGPVDMLVANDSQGARDGIGVGDLDDVLIDVIAVHGVEVAVVEVVDVAAVLDGQVAAAVAMDMRVGFVNLVALHGTETGV
jgi:hypothetical protein